MILETRLAGWCSDAAAFASEIPLKADVNPRAGSPPSPDDGVEQTEVRRIRPATDERRERRVPSTTSYMTSSAATWPFTLDCRQKNSPNEPMRPPREKSSRRSKKGVDGTAGGGAAHFVKAISTGRLSWSFSAARAGEIWISNATAVTKETTRVWVVLIRSFGNYGFADRL
jgi:hypothetical protein